MKELLACQVAEACLGRCKSSMVKLFAKIVNSQKLFAIFAKSSIIDIWQSPKYTSEFKFLVLTFSEHNLVWQDNTSAPRGHTTQNWTSIYFICPVSNGSWGRSLSYRNQSIDVQSKSMDWFLYERDLRHERVISFV